LSNSEKPASASDTLPRNHAEHDAVTEAEHDWIISQILKTEKGQLWLTKRNDWRKRRRVVVVKGGKLVNVVF
jgi:leucyl-tRNA synthetase